MRFLVLAIILSAATAQAETLRPKFSTRDGVQTTATGMISDAARATQLSEAGAECEPNEDEEFFANYCNQAKACQAQVLPLVHGLNTGHDFVFNRLGGLVSSAIDAIVGGARNIKNAATKLKTISAAAEKLNRTNERVMAVVSKGQAKADSVKTHYANLRSHYDKLKGDLQQAGDTVKIAEIVDLVKQLNDHEAKVLSMINNPVNSVKDTITKYRSEAEKIVGSITKTIDEATTTGTEYVKSHAVANAHSHGSMLDYQMGANLKYYGFHKLLQGKSIQDLTVATRSVKETVEYTCYVHQYQALLEQIGLTSSILTAGGLLIYQREDGYLAHFAANNPLLGASTACKRAHAEGITALRIAAMYAKKCYEKLSDEDRAKYEALTREAEFIQHVESTIKK